LEYLVRGTPPSNTNKGGVPAEKYYFLVARSVQNKVNWYFFFSNLKNPKLPQKHNVP